MTQKKSVDLSWRLICFEGKIECDDVSFWWENNWLAFHRTFSSAESHFKRSFWGVEPSCQLVFLVWEKDLVETGTRGLRNKNINRLHCTELFFNCFQCRICHDLKSVKQLFSAPLVVLQQVFQSIKFRCHETSKAQLHSVQSAESRSAKKCHWKLNSSPVQQLILREWFWKHLACHCDGQNNVLPQLTTDFLRHLLKINHMQITMMALLQNLWFHLCLFFWLSLQKLCSCSDQANCYMPLHRRSWFSSQPNVWEGTTFSKIKKRSPSQHQVELKCSHPVQLRNCDSSVEFFFFSVQNGNHQCCVHIQDCAVLNKTQLCLL